MMAHFSVIKAACEDDSVLLCAPVNVMDEWMTKGSTMNQKLSKHKSREREFLVPKFA
jgi:hypothetical protein